MRGAVYLMSVNTLSTPIAVICCSAFPLSKCDVGADLGIRLLPHPVSIDTLVISIKPMLYRVSY